VAYGGRTCSICGWVATPLSSPVTMYLPPRMLALSGLGMIGGPNVIVSVKSFATMAASVASAPGETSIVRSTSGGPLSVGRHHNQPFRWQRARRRALFRLRLLCLERGGLVRVAHVDSARCDRSARENGLELPPRRV
jgi:hypothetical protein